MPDGKKELSTGERVCFQVSFEDLGNGLRLRLLQPEQRYALQQRLKSAGVTSDESGWQGQEDLMAHTVQLCLVGSDKGSLKYPGEMGRRQVKMMPALKQLFGKCLEHNTVFP